MFVFYVSGIERETIPDSFVFIPPFSQYTDTEKLETDGRPVICDLPYII